MTLSNILRKSDAVGDIVVLYRPMWASKKAVPTRYDFSTRGERTMSSTALLALALAWVEDIDVSADTLYIGCRGLLPQKGN